ncbi:MAG: hypothetical protein ACRENE_10570 [Polyangiaceae bacterium]
MLEQYKKTFVAMQTTMWLISALIVFVSHRWLSGVAFLGTMQIGALLGAAWGARLKSAAGL